MLLINLANLNQERSKFDNWVLLRGQRKKKERHSGAVGIAITIIKHH